MTLKSYLRECFEDDRDENQVNSMSSVHGQDQLKKMVLKAPRQLNNRSLGQKIAEEINIEIVLLFFFLLYCWEKQKLSTYHPTLHTEIFPYTFPLNNFPLISTPIKFGLFSLKNVSVRMG